MKQLLILGSLLISMWMSGQSHQVVSQPVTPGGNQYTIFLNDSGYMQERGYLYHGLRDSVWQHFDDQTGEVIATAYYRKGVKIGTWLIKTPDHFIRITYDRGVKVLYEEVSFVGRIITSVKF